MDLHTGTLARLGHAEHESADVQSGAERVEQAAVEGVGADLGRQLGLADQCGLVSEVACQVALLSLLALEVRGAGCEAQASDAVELAVDGLLFHEPLDGVHGLAVGVVDLAGPFESIAADGLADADGEAQVTHAAVARGGARADLALLDEGDAGTLTGGVQGGGQAGQTGADDHQVRLLGEWLAGAVGEDPAVSTQYGIVFIFGLLWGCRGGPRAGHPRGGPADGAVYRWWWGCQARGSTGGTSCCWSRLSRRRRRNSSFSSLVRSAGTEMPRMRLSSSRDFTVV